MHKGSWSTPGQSEVVHQDNFGVHQVIFGITGFVGVHQVSDGVHQVSVGVDHGSSTLQFSFRVHQVSSGVHHVGWSMSVQLE